MGKWIYHVSLTKAKRDMMYENVIWKPAIGEIAKASRGWMPQLQRTHVGFWPQSFMQNEGQQNCLDKALLRRNLNYCQIVLKLLNRVQRNQIKPPIAGDWPLHFTYKKNFFSKVNMMEELLKKIFCMCYLKLKCHQKKTHLLIVIWKSL